MDILLFITTLRESDKYIETIKSLSYDLTEKQIQLKDVVFKCKKEMSDSYFKYENKVLIHFRFAIMLVFGEYRHKYDSEVVRNIQISPFKTFKTDEYENYYVIRKAYNWSYSFGSSYNNVGFVCYKKDLKYALSYEMRKLWLFYLGRNKSTISLKEFEDLFDKGDLDLYELFEDYIKEDSFLTIVNYPLLKIKNVVIYIDNK